MLLFCAQEVSMFLWIALLLLTFFCKYFSSSVPKLGSVADSRKSFSANEDMQIRQAAKLFTTKQKQYMVLISGVNRCLAMAWAWIDPHLAGPV